VPVRGAVEARLVEASATDTWRGRLALALAESIDEGTATGGGLAALGKALRETLAEVDAAVPPGGALLRLRRERAAREGSGYAS